MLVVLFATGGEVLLLRRRVPANFWQSVTGSLKAQETPRQAAEREVLEETGWVTDAELRDSGVVNRYPIHPAWQAQFAPAVRENTEYVFSFQTTAIRAVRIDSREHRAYRWLIREDAAKLATSPTDRAAILSLVPPPSPGA